MIVCFKVHWRPTVIELPMQPQFVHPIVYRSNTNENNYKETDLVRVGVYNLCGNMKNLDTIIPASKLM